MNIDVQQLREMWPGASVELTKAIADKSASVFERYKLNSPRRVAHFMAQCSHESSAGARLVENLNYTTPARLMQVWPRRFRNAKDAQPYVRNPVMLGRLVYNGRMGNIVGTDDGFNFRGRGLIQLTGREAYTRFAKATSFDLVAHPEIAAQPDACLELAAAFWASKPLNEAADADDVRQVTILVNGGTVGMNDRVRWLKLWKAELRA